MGGRRREKDGACDAWIVCAGDDDIVGYEVVN